MTRIMKEMKQLLIVIALLSCTTMLMATEYQLHQTSKATYHSVGSGGSSSAGVGGGHYQGSNVAAPYTTYHVATPTISFQSTSILPKSGSTLPSAVETIEIGADSPINKENGITGRKKARPGDNNDPFKDPLTDAVPCLLLLALGYVLYVRRKYGLPTRNSRHQQ